MPTVHRRTLLAALAVTGAAAACTADKGETSSERGGTNEPDPQLVDLADERDLLAAYDATMARHAGLRDRLAPLRDHHAQHLAALQRALGRSTTTPTVGGTPTGGTDPAQSGGATAASSVPPTPPAALAALRDRERQAATARTRSCINARVDRAPLLGSIAACEASHEVLLA